MSGVPVASYGRQPQMAEGIREKLLPEYDVVHTVLDLAAAEAELPALMSGDAETSPSSGLGTNAGKPAAERKVPKIMFFAAGIPADEVEKVTAAIKAKAAEAHCIQISMAELQAAGSTGPNVDIFVKVMKEKLAGMGL